MDVDGSGAINAEDFHLFRSRLRDVCGRDLNDPRTQQLLRLQQSWWDKVIKDADMVSDGSISAAEWHAWGEAVASSVRRSEHGTGQQLVDEWASILFELMDDNGDRFVGETEYRTFMRAFNTSDADTDSAWANVDCDKHGRLTREDFLARLRTFWTSDAPHAAGTLFFPPTTVHETRPTAVPREPAKVEIGQTRRAAGSK